MNKRCQLALLSVFLLANPLASAQEQKIMSTTGTMDDQLVTLDYRDADLSNVLRSLSYSYALNLVTSTDVKGKVTINLQDVTVDEALDALLSANNLTFTRKGNIIYINPAQTKEEKQSTVNKMVRLNYTQPADAQNLIRKVLSEIGDIRIDDTTSTLVITDYQENIDIVMDLLKDIDTPPQQVLIEAKIVDITSNDLRNMGLTFSNTYAPAGKDGGLFDRNVSRQETLQSTYRLAGSSTTLSGGQLTLDTLTLKGLTLTSTLDALIQDQKAHLLASPSIAVMNNQEARIIIGEKVPFKERTQTTTGTTETTKFIDVGTTLRVTPSINTDRYITMYIHPEVSSVNALLDAGPRITTREADTTVRIREGETVVIAGLIRQEDNQTRSEIPFLGQIPVVKHLFSSRSKDETQTELAVFITPSILHSQEELSRLTAEHRHKIEGDVIAPTSTEQGLVFTLFDTANKLEEGTNLVSRRKPEWYRLKQALAIYENIAYDFPQSPEAPECLWRASLLRYNYFVDPVGAVENINTLLDRYHKSPQTVKALGLLKEIEETMERSGTISALNREQ